MGPHSPGWLQAFTGALVMSKYTVEKWERKSSRVVRVLWKEVWRNEGGEKQADTGDLLATLDQGDVGARLSQRPCL